MSSMGGLRKETNPGGDCHWSYRCHDEHDSGIPLTERRRQGHRIVCLLRALAWISSLDVVPSEAVNG